MTMNKTTQNEKPKWAGCACRADPQMIFACSGSSVEKGRAILEGWSTGG